MAPFLVFPWSRYSCHKEIISEFPVVFNDYHEAFSNDAAIFFNLEANKRIWKKSYLSQEDHKTRTCYWSMQYEHNRLQNVVNLLLGKKVDPYYLVESGTPASMIAANIQVHQTVKEVDYQKHSDYMKKHSAFAECLRWDKMTPVNGDVYFSSPPESDLISSYVFQRNMYEQWGKRGVKVVAVYPTSRFIIDTFGTPKKKIEVINTSKLAVRGNNKREECLYVW